MSMSGQPQQHYALCIECQQKPEVMERILRVVRHRGFQLQAVNMNRSDCGERVTADLLVSGDRPLGFLMAQIEKLYDVLNVVQETRCQQVSQTASL